MTFRKIIFWLHLFAGIVAGTIIFVMSVTGVILTYERQITTWANGHDVTPPSTEAKRLPVETLLAKIRATPSNAVPTMLTLRSSPTAPATVNFGRETMVFVNPYTGETLGEGAKKMRNFFHLITDWHRWLGTNEKGRVAGRAITGGCNLAFLFLVVSGFYLWWPRQWSKSSLLAITQFKNGLRGKARDWNWHNVIGFWTAPALFFIVLTGVIMSYPWANNLLYRLTGSPIPPPRSSPGGMRETPPSSSPVKLTGLNQAWHHAEQHTADWKSITLRLPASREGDWTFTIDAGNGARPDLRSQLTLRANTGEIVKLETYESYNLGRKLRLWGRWIHTGEAAGFLGQTVAGLASLGGSILVWTGFSLTYHRWKKRGDKAVPVSESKTEVKPTLAGKISGLLLVTELTWWW